ncbi:CoA transferase [Solimonas terrae]|uniref:CoA transferase n=1 Tax=Solimonas terrae TaxID=1396819 RepID=A0A6M2BS35_9GAMM|nr:CoA transferase [Solimonas terrae]NGY04903.1 CoA transferase [Solimonas terrae]
MAAPVAARYRDALLRELGVERAPAAVGADHPARRWARSGLMQLSGRADAAPLMSPLPIASCADGALAALATLAPHADVADIDAAGLLSERAALAGLRRQGAMSAGGACRLLQAADGLLALSLARDDDWTLLPAWLECDAASWAAVEAALRERACQTLLERGRELGLAIAVSRRDGAPAAAWFRIASGAPFGGTPLAPPRRAPRVVDLSSLWAGPLCSHLLQRCGAEVIKLESISRPDGARRGAAEFFDLLNAGKRSVALDLQTSRGRAQLRALLLQADIVIEASRPRALRQLGIEADELLRENPGLSWIALSGYGRGEPQEQWIAYGDDAGVAAGLSDTQLRASGDAVFVGDAIADPLTGLHAALAALASHDAGGGRLIALSLHDVVRRVAGFDAPGDDAALRDRYRRWTAAVGADDIRMPTPRCVAVHAPRLGADTAAVLGERGIAC